MKKANTIKNVKVRENGTVEVTYMNGLVRTYKHMTKAAERWLKQDVAEAFKEEETAWVFSYLAKPGKSLYTLENAIRRMTKAEIIEKFRELGWGLCNGHSKNEMISIIDDELLRLGYDYPDTEPIKKTKKKSQPSQKEIRTGLEYIVILNDPRMSDSEKLAALGYRTGMDANKWYDMIAIAGMTAVKAYGYSEHELDNLDDLFRVVINSAA